jgi:hypothetical protein
MKCGRRNCRHKRTASRPQRVSEVTTRTGIREIDVAEFELGTGRKNFGLGIEDGSFELRSDDTLRRKVREAVERRALEKTSKMVGITRVLSLLLIGD